MIEFDDPKRFFADAALPVRESLRLVRNEGGNVCTNDDSNPEFCLTAAIGIVRAMAAEVTIELRTP